MIAQNIEKQLTLIYDGEPWYGNSIKKVLESVNPDCIFDSPGKGMHSIAELVTHMIAYRKFAEERLQGDTDDPPEQEETFNWKNLAAPKNRFWETAVKQLQINQKNLCRLLEQADDALPDQTVPGKSYTFQYMLEGIVRHDLYHLGQIVYINKLLNQ